MSTVRDPNPRRHGHHNHHENHHRHCQYTAVDKDDLNEAKHKKTQNDPTPIPLASTSMSRNFYATPHLDNQLDMEGGEEEECRTESRKQGKLINSNNNSSNSNNINNNRNNNSSNNNSSNNNSSNSNSSNSNSNNSNKNAINIDIQQGASTTSAAPENCVKQEMGVRPRLLYKLTDNPPPLLCLMFALQQGLLAIATPLTTAFIVCDVICAENNDDVKTRILSATFFMMGLSTFAMATFGVRLPVFQGPNFTYVLPILGMLGLEEFKCPAVFEHTDSFTNVTTKMARISDDVSVPQSDVISARMNGLSGSLMLVGAIHCLIGVTGFVGFLANFIGPITIVPIIMLFGFQIHGVVAMFSESHWGIALMTTSIALILSLYLAKFKTPIPLWTPSKGFHVAWQPVHAVFAIFISVILGWSLCLVLTELDLLSDNPSSKESLSRTDSRFQIVRDIDWFLVHYPGRYGLPSINITTVITFFIATLMSVVDSIGDYSATARIAYAPQPPKFALNRGIAVEGLMVFMGGAFGCGHGTVSFGENIGAMKLTGVVSRRVFQTIGIMYAIFGCLGKIGAFFITIPHAVMGGIQLVTFGLLIGVTLSLLQNVDLGSTRNLSILGISLLLGTMVPAWISGNASSIQTGSVQGDAVLKAMLTNPSFVGGFLACLLDNTVPGTRFERGILAQLYDIGDDTGCGDEDEDGGGGGGCDIGGGSGGDGSSGNAGGNGVRGRNGGGSVSSGDKIDCGSGGDDVSVGGHRPGGSRGVGRGGRGTGLLHGREVYRLPWLPDSVRRSCIVRHLPIFDHQTEIR